MKIIRAEIGGGKQSITYTGIFEHDKVTKTSNKISSKEIHDKSKIRITVKSDSYDFQSYARSTIWQDNHWNHVTGIDYSNMNTAYGLAYVKHTISPVDFQNDVDQLIKQTLEIID